MKSFKENILSDKKFKKPNQKGFNFKDWEKKYHESSNEVIDESLYEGGKLLFNLLEELRKILIEQKNFVPVNLTNHEMVLLLCGFTNEQCVTAFRKIAESVKSTRSYYDSMIQSDTSENYFTIPEMRESHLESIQLVLKQYLSRVENNEELIGKEGHDYTAIKFMEVEFYLSTYYNLFEGYWNVLLYSDYLYISLKNKQLFIQSKTQKELSRIVFHARREKIYRQKKMLILQDVLSKQNNLKYVVPSKTEGSVVVEHNNKKILYLYHALENDYFQYSKEFTDEAMEQIHKEFDFSIFHLFSIFRLLSLYAVSYESKIKKFNNNGKFWKENELKQYLPKINKRRLIHCFSIVSKIDCSRIDKIIQFLTLTVKKDIWNYPIININSEQIGLLFAPLLSPHMPRLIEDWQQALGVDLQSKGSKFEKTVITEINKSLRCNHFINDYDLATEIKYEEEIDVIFRLGTTIIVGESKSIVVPDTPKGYSEANKRVEDGVDQIIRKSEFVRNNLEKLFSKLGWSYNLEHTYNIIGFVITSNGIRAGFPTNNIPICDLEIIVNYLQSPVIPLVSKSITEPIVWYDCYQNFEELQSNLLIYLQSPPQLEPFKFSSYYDVQNICSHEKYGIFQEYRLRVKPFCLEDLKLLKSSFQLKKSISDDELEEYEQAIYI